MYADKSRSPAYPWTGAAEGHGDEHVTQISGFDYMIYTDEIDELDKHSSDKHSSSLDNHLYISSTLTPALVMKDVRSPYEQGASGASGEERVSPPGSSWIEGRVMGLESQPPHQHRYHTPNPVNENNLRCMNERGAPQAMQASYLCWEPAGSQHACHSQQPHPSLGGAARSSSREVGGGGWSVKELASGAQELSNILHAASLRSSLTRSRRDWRAGLDSNEDDRELKELADEDLARVGNELDASRKRPLEQKSANVNEQLEMLKPTRQSALQDIAKAAHVAQEPTRTTDDFGWTVFNDETDLGKEEDEPASPSLQCLLSRATLDENQEKSDEEEKSDEVCGELRKQNCAIYQSGSWAPALVSDATLELVLNYSSLNLNDSTSSLNTSTSSLKDAVNRSTTFTSLHLSASERHTGTHCKNSPGLGSEIVCARWTHVFMKLTSIYYLCQRYVSRHTNPEVEETAEEEEGEGEGGGDRNDSDSLALLNFIKPVRGLGSVSSERKRLRRHDLEWLPHAVTHAIRCTSPENDCESRHELERARAAEAECRTEARLQHIMSSSGSDGFTARHAAHALLKSATVSIPDI